MPMTVAPPRNRYCVPSPETTTPPVISICNSGKAMSKAPRQLKLGAFFSTPGNHLAGWRHPDAVPTVDMDFKEYVKLAQTAERGCFDMIFFQDTVAVAGSR